MPEPLRPRDPRQIGRYRISARLGEGGQGVVFLGTTPSDELVAIKLLRAEFADDSDARNRFVREVATAERVSGPYTARILDADVMGDAPYVVSEYVDAHSLQRVLADGGPLSGTALDNLLVGAATALAAIHGAGVMHRDFKPANILMAPTGPKVIDFGIARALDATATVSSAVIGTPLYMAPEQFAPRDDRPPGPPVDVFAWAATMATAVTGRAPFGADDIPRIMHRVVYAEPDLDGIDEPLRGFLFHCLAKDPSQRPTAGQVLSFVREKPRQRPGPPPEQIAYQGSGGSAGRPAERWGNRTKILAIAAALALVAGVVGLVMRLNRPTDPATTSSTTKTSTTTQKSTQPSAGNSASGRPSVPAGTDTNLAQLVPGQVKADGKITIGTSPYYPPLEFLEENGKLAGMDVEIFDAVAAKLGLESEWTSTDYADIGDGVASGRFEIGVSSHMITQDRLTKYRMIPYFNSASQWVVRKGNPGQVSIQDPCGHRVGVQIASPAASELDAKATYCRGRQLTVDKRDSRTELIDALRAGRLDALVADLPIATWALSQHSGQFELLGDPQGQQVSGFVLSKQQPELANAIAQATKAIVADGTYDRILRKYGNQKGALTSDQISVKTGR